METLPQAYDRLGKFNQFIIYKLITKEDGRVDKVPIDYNTIKPINAHDQKNWLDANKATNIAKIYGEEYGVGFVLTSSDPFFFIDIDHCLLSEGLWSSIAHELCDLFPEAAVEVSQSREGLHIIGSYTQDIPKHKCKNSELSIELYTNQRFVALTGFGVRGDASANCNDELAKAIQKYFSLSEHENIKANNEWRDTPVSDWSGIEDDELLIKKLLNHETASSIFGDTASFKDLWTANVSALSHNYPAINDHDPYDRSSADMALANRLAFWTGNNHERIKTLMLRSSLNRGKWKKHKTYLKRTIENAVSVQKTVYQKTQSNSDKLSYQHIVEIFKEREKDFSYEETDDVLKKVASARLNTIQELNIYKELKGKSFIKSKKDFQNAVNDYRNKKSDKITHPKIAEAVIERIGRDNLIYCQSFFWQWEGGIWKRVDDQVIRQTIHTICHQKLSSEFSKSIIDSVFDLVKTELFQPNTILDSNNNDFIINVLNGELHFIDGSWKLLEHNRKNYFTTQMPVEFDPNAQAPKFVQFITDVFWGDSDPNEKFNVLLEMIGYSMLTSCIYEKFIILVGNGANGKSVLLSVLETLLGKQNICAVQPSEFDNKFQRAHLNGKLVNVVTEIAEGAVLADAQLKSIVSGEITTAEHKNKAPFEFRPYSTCWFATNHMPHVRDFSNAIFRRAIVIEFNNQFYGEACNPNLTNELAAELEGILNYALNALAQVILRGSMSICHSSESAKLVWKKEADQVQQFIEEMCSINVDARIVSNQLYENYVRWAQAAGIKNKLSKIKFGKRLDKLGYQSCRTANSRQRCGLEMKEIFTV